MNEQPKTEPEIAQARKASVETLQEFYAVVVGIALAGGVEKFVTSVEGNLSFHDIVKLVAISIAFLSTIVPFYHGMNRHLYETHIVGAQTGERGYPIPLLVDIFLFILEAGLLFAMGRALADPEVFLKLWSALLLVDIAWSLVVWRVQKSEKPIWALNNLVWCCVAWIIWLTAPILLRAIVGAPVWVDTLKVCLIAVVEMARSVTDYRLYWDFYFPGSKGKS